METKGILLIENRIDVEMDLHWGVKAVMERFLREIEKYFEIWFGTFFLQNLLSQLISLNLTIETVYSR